MLEGPCVRPRAVERRRQLRARSDGGQIFQASQPRADTAEREVMLTVPRRVPIRPHYDAGLVVIGDEQLGALAIGRKIAGGMADGKVGRIRGDDTGTTGNQECGGKGNAHPVQSPIA